MKTEVRFAAARRVARGDRPGVRRPDRGGDHEDGFAARPRDRERVEVIESIEVLKGQRACGSRGAFAGARGANAGACRCRVERCRGAAGRSARRSASGEALDRFRRIIEIQGGDPRVVDDYSRLPTAPERAMVLAPRSGYVGRLDAELIGRASVALGAGRDRVDDDVDPAVGIVVKARPGDRGPRRRSGAGAALPYNRSARRGPGACRARDRHRRRAAAGAAPDSRAHLMTQSRTEHLRPSRARLMTPLYEQVEAAANAIRRLGAR